jgi:FG-GAP repeat
LENLVKRYPTLVSGAAVLMVTTLTAGFPPRTHLSAAAFQREHGQGGLHRDDPCDQLPDPPGEANGIDKICAAGGSSSGTAKGDFNGDGFADLAVGVPGEDTPNDVSNSGAVNVISAESLERSWKVLGLRARIFRAVIL